MIKIQKNKQEIFKEINDSEILLMAEQTGSFDFLYEDSEDIYSLDDGDIIPEKYKIKMRGNMY